MFVRLALLVVALCGCSDQRQAAIADLAGTCDETLPACPTTPPSWSATVEPLVQAACVTCHAPGGNADNIPLTSLIEWSARAVACETQVTTCQMPQAPEPPLTVDQRDALLEWLVCGAPDN